MIKVTESMKLYGGGFFELLAEAILAADEMNAKKIKWAFKEEWDQFLKM